MENRFGAPASGTPEGSARREFELLLLLGGSRKAAVQLWLRKQRIYANAQQAAGRPATEAKGSRGAAERQAGGESKPETAAQAARRHRSEHRLREKHLARKIWAAVRVRKHLSRWCERARAAVAKRPAPSSTTSTAAAAPPPAPPPPPPAPDQAQARATPPAGAAAAASSAPDIFMMEGPQEGELPLQPLTHTLSVMPNMVEAILLSVLHLVIAAACARASTSLSALEHAHDQEPHGSVRAGADAGARCVVRVSGLRTASHSQGALRPSLTASTDRCARRAGCTPITRSSHAERIRPGQLRSGADEAPVRNASRATSNRG